MLALKQPLVRRKVLARLVVVPLRGLLLDMWRGGKCAAGTRRIRCKTAGQQVSRQAAARRAPLLQTARVSRTASFVM